MSIKMKQTASMVEFKTKLIAKIKEEFDYDEDFDCHKEVEKIINIIENFGGKGKKPTSSGEKKPLSAYQKFVKDNLSKVRDENPHMKGPDAMREVGRMWKKAKEAAEKDEKDEKDVKDEKDEKDEKAQKSKK